MGHTMETKEVNCSLNASGMIPASLIEGLVDRPGYTISRESVIFETIGPP